MATDISQVIYREDKSNELFKDTSGIAMSYGEVYGKEEGGKDIDELHPSYAKYALKRKIISDVLEGTMKMREWAHYYFVNRARLGRAVFSTYNYNCIDYFPQKEKETETEYFIRVNKLLMSQYVGKTIDTYVGMVFRKPAYITGSPPPKIEKLAENINFEGDNLNMFGQDCLRAAIEDGIAFIYVQTSRSKEVTAKEFASTGRTWFTLIKADDLLDWNHVMSDAGQLVLDYIVINLDPHSRQPKRLWVNRKDYRLYKQNEHGKFELESEGEHGYREIPLYPIYSKKKKGEPRFVAEPPLLEMAWAQIMDMNKRSDLDHGEEHSCYTSVYITSKLPADELGLSGGMGTNRILVVPDADAKVGQITTNSQGLAEARKGVEDNKRRIFEEGLSFVAEKKSHTRTTATEISSDREIQVSALLSTVLSLQNAFNRALVEYGYLEGIEQDKTVIFKFNNDLNMLSLDPTTAALLSKMNVLGQLSFDTLLEVLKRGEILPHDIDAVSERLRINGQANTDIRDKTLEIEAPDTSESYEPTINDATE